MKSETKSGINSAEPLRLEKITWDNYNSIINLHVHKEQRNFVASNKDSLVHACVSMTAEKSRYFPLVSIKEKGRSDLS